MVVVVVVLCWSCTEYWLCAACSWQSAVQHLTHGVSRTQLLGTLRLNESFARQRSPPTPEQAAVHSFLATLSLAGTVLQGSPPLPKLEP